MEKGDLKSTDAAKAVETLKEVDAPVVEATPVEDAAAEEVSPCVTCGGCAGEGNSSKG